MNKKYFRIFTIIFGSILLLLLIVNFSINFWLKNNLPDYLKKNTNYQISYQKLDVELLSGNILAQGITVNNKNPNQNKILGLQGTIDSITISRLGIYDAIFNKRISTKSIVLAKPVLNIQLPEKTNKSKKEQNPIELKNLEIRNGKIQVFKANKRKIAGSNDLNLKITDLELSSETQDNGLPVGFDSYSIEANKVYFRPDNVYLFLADQIKTKDGVLNIRKFSFLPLLSYSQFTHYYPTKSNLFNLKSSEAVVEGFNFKNKKIDLKSFRLEQPNVKIYTTGVKPKAKDKKDFTLDVNLGNLILNNATVDVEKPNQTPLFTGGNLNLNISKIVMNGETTKESLPFQYEAFALNGKNINYFTENDHLSVLNLKVDPKNIVLNQIALKSENQSSDKNYFDVNTKSVSIKLKEWKMVDSKLKMEIDDVLVDEIKGKIATSKVKTEKKNKPSFLDFPLKIHKINLKNSDLNVESKGKPMALNGLNLNINELELNQNEAKQLLMKSANYNFTANSLIYNPSQFYKISANAIKVTEKGGNISNFAMIPLVSRAQFIKMIPTEKDLYNLKAASISFAGNYDLLNQDKIINLSNVTLNNMNANIFRSKIPKDDLTVKPLYSKMLRSIKFPLFINNLDIKNSILVYEEDIATSDGPGKLEFDNFNLNVKNINSGKMKGKPTQVAITINSGFMNGSPLHLNWGFNVLDQNDRFTISGNVGNMPAPRLNPFIEPYLHVTATGVIKKLNFSFTGNPVEINGTMKMDHDNLKIAIRDKDSGKKKKLLSGIANLFIKTDAEKYPESVSIEHVKRDNTKSFFNLLWKGMENGLAKHLIGINFKESVDNVKSTVKDAKETVKDVGKAVENVTDKLKADDKKAEPEKKKGFFNRIFK
ncbi:AsmA family protein [Halpernia frigidisoli]|uniref:Uncharacterized protein n=1 Tax=Halpernia frigidisoli TaxID=1125876 RepID=A0A1I3GS07_9FLAO|nr:hypothetical protein [Halpernia frigidisoli]SFI26217.1 hypothetical protein SAMN05443292_1992 [Halpernia frigidisoli]